MFGKRKKTIQILAPLEGEVIPVTAVNDPVFGQELLGKGVAIRPTSGRVVSPVNGTLIQVFKTGHAVTLSSDDGAEILIHIGLDTVELEGKHYSPCAEDGQEVKVGDMLIEFDLESIAAAGFDTVTPVVICNSGDFAQVEGVTGKTVQESEEIIRLIK